MSLKSAHGGYLYQDLVTVSAVSENGSPALLVIEPKTRRCGRFSLNRQLVPLLRFMSGVVLTAVSGGFPHTPSLTPFSATTLPLQARCEPRSAHMQYALAQQVELCPAIHLAFDQLQPVDLPFELAVAPAGCERCLHRVVVRSQTACKHAKFARYGPVARTLDPVIQPMPLTIASHGDEFACQRGGRGHFRAPLKQRLGERPVLVVEIARRFQKQPGQSLL
jgi:hypothetical protein